MELITQLANLQTDMDELKCTCVSTVEESSPEEISLVPTPAHAGPWMPFNSSPSPAVLNISRPGSWIPFDPSQSPALVDLSNRSVGGGTVASCEHVIAQEDVDQCLAACRAIAAELRQDSPQLPEGKGYYFYIHEALLSFRLVGDRGHSRKGHEECDR